MSFYKVTDSNNVSHQVIIGDVDAHADNEGYQANVDVGGESSTVYLQLPSTPDSRHSVISGGDLPGDILNGIALLIEKTL